MSWISRATPINVLQEKEKFFADVTYNPQFIYADPLPTEELIKFGKPQKKYLELARSILKQAYTDRNEADLVMMEGKKLSQEEVTYKFTTFLKIHGLLERYQIQWSSSFVSRASITANTVKLRNNANYYRDDVLGLIYHELGTHAIRRVNNEMQPWFKKKNQFGLSTAYLRTEEGLAVLHSLLPRNFKLAYITALRYLAVEYAQHHSFAETWNFLSQYVQDPETKWMVASRQKRGITDTSKSGGATKDLVYFEGVVETWKWLEQHDFDPTLLYFGKIASEDAEKVQAISPHFKPLLPYFFVKDPQQYKKDMKLVGMINNF